MKGISAVLATVLIVVITVAIIGMAYGWSTGMFKMVADTSEDQVGGVTDSLSKSVEIIATNCYNETTRHCKDVLLFTVKNIGTKKIDIGEVTAFIDNLDISNSFNIAEGTDITESVFAVGETKQFRYEIVDVTYFNLDKKVVLKINAPAGSVEEDVTCPYIVICNTDPGDNDDS